MANELLITEIQVGSQLYKISSLTDDDFITDEQINDLLGSDMFWDGSVE